MKLLFTIIAFAHSFGLASQIQQNINKYIGIVSEPINQIDSIRFDAITNQMFITTINGSEIHNLNEIINVTFNNSVVLTPCNGGIIDVTDIEGNVYPVVQIGNQCWTAENLKTTQYNDGTLIPNETNNQLWADLTTPAWCYYDNNPSYDLIYGKLYNWYTVSSGNICPIGWHVPTDTEWTVLADYLGGKSSGAEKLKSTTGWNEENISATNESGFSALPGGYRDDINGTFSRSGDSGYWWSSTDNDIYYAWTRLLFYQYENIGRFAISKKTGNSLRCIQD